ncbi:MAG: RHS repeat-associated core domain-containing protein, partial [Eubacteriales bacterium]
NLPYSVSYAYDHAGRVLSETDVFGNAATNTYDNAGQLLTAADRSGMVMSYTYDALGRAVLVHDGSKYVRSYYDDNGNLVKEIEASSANGTRGHIKTYEYDDLNRLTYSFNSTSDTDLASYNGVEEYYSYDVMGNVLTTSQHSDGGYFGTTYTYDILGRKTSMKDAEDNTETYTYNLDGTMKTKTDRESTVFTYSNYNVFKNAQRIKAVNGDKTQTIGFGYDMMNNLTSESNSESDHSVSYSYDFLGRLIKQDGFYVVNEYAYDTLGNRTSLTLNRQAISGNLYEISAQSYTYDAKSRLTESTAFDKTAEYSYNESDQLTNKRLGVLRTQRNRNNKNLVTREFIVEPTSDVSNKTYHEVDYTYDYKSDLTGENIDSDRYSFSVWYTYDGAGRLKNASIGDNHRLGTHERVYGSDSNGNINMNYKGYNGQLGSTGTKTTYTYELNNHIWGLSWLYDENNTQKGFQVFESDSNGNRYKDAGKTAEFDLFNRMVKYTDENGAETTYTYTASGLRESKTTSDGVQTFYVWDGGNMVLEYVVTDPDNLVGEYRKFYIYGADGLAYRKDLDGSIYTYNTNYRGDVLSVMDEEQTIKAEYIYDAYGNLVESSIAAGFSDNFGYRGEYHDPESGYIYLRNRYLDPKTGSFTTEDPIRDGLNWFSYCNGNPVKFTDPWGLKVGIRDEELLNYITVLSDDKLSLTYDEKENVYFIGIDEEIDGNKPVGTSLLRDLIYSDNISIIEVTDEDTKTDPTSINKKTGTSNTIIYFNPKSENKYLVEEVDRQTGVIYSVESVMPNEIKMAHELIHTYHYFTIPRTVMQIGRSKLGYYTYPSKTPGGRINIGADPIEEIETVGYSYMPTLYDFFHRINVFRGGETTKYTENQIRAEHGLPMVTAYSERLLR